MKKLKYRTSYTRVPSFVVIHRMIVETVALSSVGNLGTYDTVVLTDFDEASVVSFSKSMSRSR